MNKQKHQKELQEQVFVFQAFLQTCKNIHLCLMINHIIKTL